jgi:hypothetical protein
LLYRQLVYLYSHGTNRWAAHEIANIAGMTELLLTDSTLSNEITLTMRQRLLAAMATYKHDSTAVTTHSHTDVDRASINDLINQGDQWTNKLCTTARY